MPECGHCGAHLSETYVRVAIPEDERPIRACPFCPDRIRKGPKVRQARSERGSQGRGRGPAERGGGEE